MRQYFREHGDDMLDSFFQGLRDGMLCAMLVLILFTGAELLNHVQATLAIVRDMRGEFRTAVSSKESTEE